MLCILYLCLGELNSMLALPCDYIHFSAHGRGASHTQNGNECFTIPLQILGIITQVVPGSGNQSKGN